MSEKFNEPVKKISENVSQKTLVSFDKRAFDFNYISCTKNHQPEFRKTNVTFK